MDFNLSIPVKVISGENCVRENASLFAPFGKRCLIVTGRHSAKMSGALDDVISALKENAIAYQIYDGMGENPLLSSCHEAGKQANAFSADFIVGIGGGSALDGAKAAAVYAANPDFSFKDIYAAAVRNRALPLILIGTTAGTGSEVGRVAVLTDDKTGRKKSIAYEDCNPALTFADYRYTASMPYSVTVSTALDALAHAVEGWFSPKCGDIPALFAEKGIPMIWQELKAMLDTQSVPESAGRERLYYGSLYAGITLAYCGTAFPHPLGYVLTENYGVPHGMACAVFMPALIDRAEQFESEKLAKLLSLTGETKESFKTVVSSLVAVGNIQMTESEIEKHCARWQDTVPKNFIFSPGGFTREEAAKLFEALFSAK
ncbi:MAG: iron-containing alcohol dehydrogenase [Acutalibacteraceae bacterium]